MRLSRLISSLLLTSILSLTGAPVFAAPPRYDEYREQRRLDRMRIEYEIRERARRDQMRWERQRMDMERREWDRREREWEAREEQRRNEERRRRRHDREAEIIGSILTEIIKNNRK
ncbi:MAG: hypothetical protein IJR35_02065 [Synergistaceae bacterium]|nr:hypothetical protein [Synergistaceae bacterium]MBQ9594626.1 hypothetical protein [Synergistaceae bacterium]MBR0203495.1 hypothetical protein [Synergistaceae bacterium]